MSSATSDEMDALIRQNLSYLTEPHRSGRIGLAVSGGGDSMAMLCLVSEWAREHAIHIEVATVDHGLREVAHEIEIVRNACERRGITHCVLKLEGVSSVGNLQNTARSLRYEALRGWSSNRELDVVLLGHTADDEIETFLMNLGRGSGVDGLAGMGGGPKGFSRPLRDVFRADLRAYLELKSEVWAEDPSNMNRNFTRVRARQMQNVLAELGLTPDRLLRTVGHMKRASLTLENALIAHAQKVVQQEQGDLLVPRVEFVSLSGLYGHGGDTQGRLLSRAIQWITGTPHKPRYDALQRLSSQVTNGATATFSGCLFSSETDRSKVRISRELSACGGTESLQPGSDHILWDRRWRVSVPSVPLKGLVIRALGEAIKDVPGWRDVGLPRTSLMATPAVFEGDTLIAAPVAGLQNGFEARIVADFTSFLLSR